MRAAFVCGSVIAWCGVFAACSSSSGGGGSAAGAGGSGGAAFSAGSGGLPSAAGSRNESGAAGQRESASAGEGGEPSASQGGAAGADVGAAGAPGCESGDVGCDGLTPLTCQRGQMQPSGSACQFACHDGACSGACAAGATRCDGKVFETCGANNQWQDGTACAFVCDEAQGCIGNCTPGALKCGSATELDVCDAQGAFDKTNCDLQCATISNKPQCVECTSGDGLCPGGCTHPEDSDCAPDTLSDCPNLYFGTGRYKKPQPAELANDSVGAVSPLKVGEARLFSVTIYNHGNEPSPAVSVEVFWGDASDGCTKNLHALNTTNFTFVTSASTLPPADGSQAFNFGWAPDATALATNGGKVCLVARASELSAPDSGCAEQTYDGASPTTDPMSAVYVVQIVAAN